MSETESFMNIRASSWGRLFDCAYAWEGSNILGMRKPGGMRALLGTSIHKSTAVFDSGRIPGGDAVTADEAAGALSDSIWHPEFEVDKSGDDLTEREAEKIGLGLHSRYCSDVSPQYEYKAVELTTDPFEIDCGDGVIIRLTGSLDRSRLVAGSTKDRICDLKSGATSVQEGVANIKGHFAQVGTYELLYEHTTGREVDTTSEIIGLKTKGKPEIAANTIIGARERMTGTDTLTGLIEYAARMFRTGDFYPNPGSMLCGAKYCARWSSCGYRER